MQVANVRIRTKHKNTLLKYLGGGGVDGW